jgi:hypothetical protein
MSVLGHGTPITIPEAQVILDKQLEITALFKPVLKVLTPPYGTALSNYYTGDMNAFIFDRGIIEKLLKQPGVENLMIVLGAHPKPDGNFKEGDPTVILIGCNEPVNANEQRPGEPPVEFKVVAGTMASEHPPYQVVGKLEPFTGNQITFTLLLK